MIKKLLVLGISACMAFACVACGDTPSQSNTGSTGGSSGSSSGESSGETLDETFSISYAFEGSSIPDLMWKPNGNYPNSYRKNTQIELDGLRHCRKDDGVIYAFEGWYYDENYTYLVVDNIISSGQEGDLQLYAKIAERAKEDGDEVVASITYKWNDFGTMKEGADSFPETMIKDITLPTEYIEGVGVSLPVLHSTTYEFDGWCYDISCQNRVQGNCISADKTGNVILYAAMSIWVN